MITIPNKNVFFAVFQIFEIGCFPFMPGTVEWNTFENDWYAIFFVNDYFTKELLQMKENVCVGTKCQTFSFYQSNKELEPVS